MKRGADLHMAQLMPLPLTVFCFSEIQIGFTFLVPAHPGSPPDKGPLIARACVCVCVCLQSDGTSTGDGHVVDNDVIRYVTATKADTSVVQCNVSNRHGYLYANIALTVIGQLPIGNESCNT